MANDDGFVLDCVHERTFRVKGRGGTRRQTRWPSAVPSATKRVVQTLNGGGLL